MGEGAGAMSGRCGALTAGMLAAAMVGRGADPDARPASAPATHPAEPAWARIDCPAAPVLAGEEMTVRLQAAAPGSLEWQLGYDKVRVKHGNISLDRHGAATLRLKLPQVRHRAVFELLVLGGGEAISREVTVFPAVVLDRWAAKLAAWDLGAVDPDGAVTKALAAEQVTPAPLDSQLTRDSFTGDAVVLAGLADPADLAEQCRRFSGRLADGMQMLVVNPPPGWEYAGVRSVERPKPPAGGVRLAAAMGRWMAPADLGTGPWRQVLAAESGVAGHLVWLEIKRPRNGEDDAADVVRYPLAVQRRIGRGHLVAASLPQLRLCVSDAVGRRALCQLILILLGETEGLKRKEARP